MLQCVAIFVCLFVFNLAVTIAIRYYNLLWFLIAY